MANERVSLVECGEYGPGAVDDAVGAAFDLLGGPSSVVRPGRSVFVKVNAVTASAPETARVTNPEVARAVIEQFMKVTDRVTVGDSPGGPFTPALLKRVYEKTGIARVARDTGAGLALDTRTVEVPFPGGRSAKRLTLCASMIEADALVSVSKFKSHRYMNVTGPVKNLYGAVPGTTKFVYHSRFSDDRAFADLVVDVHLAANPVFHLVDAVEGIDGDGSRKGDIKRMGVIAASCNAFALESLMLDLAGLEPADSKVLAAAISRGICPGGGGWIDVLGAEVDSMRIEGFRLPRANVFSERVPARLAEWLSRFFTATPEPQPDKCTACGTCVEVCPRGAISIRGGVAVVDRRRCIRCFCCQELCVHEAVDIRKPL